MNTIAFAYPGPETIARTVLDNGLVVLARENHAAPLISLDGYLPAGSIHDPAGQAGLSAFVAGMLSRGSEGYDFDAFNEAIEAVGANLTFASDKHMTNFSLSCLSEDFPRLLVILADAIRHPTFPKGLVERLRNQKQIGLQERAQDTASMANLRYHETIYGDHPYGWATSGYADTIARITADDLRAFHTQHYTPQGAILAVAGDLQAALLLDQVEDALGDWRGPSPEQSVPPVAFPTQTQRIDHHMSRKFQADIVLGVPAVPRHHPDYYAIRVANTVLGVFGLMGRLGESVREAKGLAYYAYSAQEANQAAGLWTAAAGVNAEQVEPALAAIRAECARLAAELVPPEELADSQAYLTGVLPLTLETNDGVASSLLNMEWYQLGLDFLLRYHDLIYAVTPADVQRVAQSYLAGGAEVTVVAGP
jgi:zinc protease